MLLSVAFMSSPMDVDPMVEWSMETESKNVLACLAPTIVCSSARRSKTGMTQVERARVPITRGDEAIFAWGLGAGSGCPTG